RSGFVERILRQFGTAKVLAGVISQEIAFQEAERRGIVAPRAEIDARVDEVMLAEEAEAGGRENLEREYARLGLTLADVRRDHEQQIEPQIILSRLVASLRKVDDAALREYYQQTFAHTRYQTRHIAYSFRPRQGQTDEDVGRLKLEAIHKANRAADRIREGADFATIARAESEDTVTASYGGELGAIHEGSPGSPEFMKIVFKLRDGEVSDPVENPHGGYHVFQVTNVLPSESYVDCKEKIRREIQEREPTMDEVKAALMGLRERADVRLLDPSLGQGPSGDGKGS
ncbi:MAG TPA: peptidylprolyl isomerase, partial [Planctomycetota bacterium]|nr:peptidylprolyl isomerase [Planctomycetota bacterium]